MMAFCLKKIDIIQFFTPTVLSKISLKHIKHCANTEHSCHVRQAIFLHRNIQWFPGEGKAEGWRDAPRHCWLCHEKEMNTSHIYSHNSLHASMSLLSSEKLKTQVIHLYSNYSKIFFRWRSMTQTQDKPRKVTAYSNWLFCNKLAKTIWCWCAVQHDGWASWAGISLLTPRPESFHNHISSQEELHESL